MQCVALVIKCFLLQQHCHIMAVSVLSPCQFASRPSLVARAVELFWQDGAIVIEDVVSGDACDVLYATLLDDVVSAPSQWELRSGGLEGTRFSWRTSSSSSPSSPVQRHYSPILDADVIMDVLTSIMGWFHWCKIGGDCVMPGCNEDQHLHSDWASSPTTSRPPAICVSCFLGPGDAAKAPLRLFNWQMMVACQPASSIWSQHGVPSLESLTPAQASALVVAPKGSICIRDVRVWHGGTAMGRNFCTPRVLPGLICISHEYIHTGSGDDDPDATFFRPRRCMHPTVSESLGERAQAHCHYLYSCDTDDRSQ